MKKRVVLILVCIAVVVSIFLIKTGDKAENKVENTLEKSEGVEEELVSLILKGNLTKEQKKEMLALLPDVDWQKGSEIRIDKNYDASSKIVDWLYSEAEGANIKDADDILNVIKTYVDSNLDGAYTEGVSAALGEIYIYDMENFVKALHQIPEAIKDMASVLQFEGIYTVQMHDVGEDMSLFLNSSILDEKEKKTGIQLLQEYNALCNT